MDVHHHRGVCPQVLDQWQAEGQVRDETVVHHVEVDRIRTGDSGDLSGEVGEVSVEDTRRNGDSHAVSLAGSAAQQGKEHRIGAVTMRPQLHEVAHRGARDFGQVVGGRQDFHGARIDRGHHTVGLGQMW